ncbi:hypothetical protein FWK35_00017196, partial [Aphis craccivora]
QNNALISNFGLVSDVKRSKVNIFQQFSKKIEKNNQKMTENGNFYAKLVFEQIDFFIWFSNFYEICLKRENLQIPENCTSIQAIKT